MKHWVPSTHFRTETRFSKSPSLRTEPSLNKSRPAVSSQNSAQQPDNCNMVTWSVLKQSNTHIAKELWRPVRMPVHCSPGMHRGACAFRHYRNAFLSYGFTALLCATRASLPNAPRSLPICAQSKCIPLIRFHCTAMRNTRFTAVTATL